MELAVEQGCSVIRKGKRFTVLACPEELVDTLYQTLGLYRDIEVHVQDTDANDIVMATPLHDLGYTGAGVNVAILDTGIDYNHPELSSSYVGGYDFVNEDSDPLDDHGHGTQMAGVITSDGLNPTTKGIAPEAGIVAMKIQDENGSGFLSETAESVYYVVDNFNVTAISISISSSEPIDLICDPHLQYYYDAVQYALDHNVMVVLIAGNVGSKGIGVGAPGCLSNDLTIGSTDNDDEVSSFSGYGPLVDLYAPGRSLYTCNLDSGYTFKSGTSLSAPLVAGIVALLKEKKPDATVAEIRQVLVDTADLIEQPDESVIRRVNAARAIMAIAPVTPPQLTIQRTNDAVVVSWPAEADLFTLQERDYLNAPSAWSDASVARELNGDIFTARLTNLDSSILFRLRGPLTE